MMELRDQVSINLGVFEEIQTQPANAPLPDHSLPPSHGISIFVALYIYIYYIYIYIY